MTPVAAPTRSGDARDGPSMLVWIAFLFVFFVFALIGRQVGDALRADPPAPAAPTVQAAPGNG